MPMTENRLPPSKLTDITETSLARCTNHVSLVDIWIYMLMCISVTILPAGNLLSLINHVVLQTSGI